DDVDAIAVVLDHARKPADLAFDSFEPFQAGRLDLLAHQVHIPPRGISFKRDGIEKWPMAILAANTITARQTPLPASPAPASTTTTVIIPSIPPSLPLPAAAASMRARPAKTRRSRSIRSAA